MAETATVDTTGQRVRWKPTLESIGLVYLTAASALPTILPINLGLVSSQLVVALGLAWLGWRHAMPWTVLPGFWVLGVAFAIATVVSSISAWTTSATYWSVTNLLWFAFIVPGLAVLMREEWNRRAFVFGLALAATVYGVTAAVRLATAGSIFDPGPGQSAVMFGMKRGFTNAQLLLVVPFVVWYWRRPILRLVLLALIVLVLVTSGGRSALVGLALVGLVYALMLPSTGKKLRALAAVGLSGGVVVFAITTFGGESAVGLERLTTYLQGERGTPDERREQEVQRAWRVGIEHPLFGIGYGELGDFGVGPLESSEAGSLLRPNEQGGAHNTYAEAFAELGAPAILSLFAFLVYLLMAAVRARERADVRAAAAGFVAILMMLAFHPLSVSVLYYHIPFLLGAVADLWGPSPDTTAGRRAARSAR